MAAQPAIRIKTVVGRPGMKTPAMPSPSEVTASVRSSQRVYQRRAMAGAGMGEGLSEGAGSGGWGMRLLCLCKAFRVGVLARLLLK